MLSVIFSDAQSIISIITFAIDMFAIAVIAVSVFTTILPLIKTSAALSLPFVIKSSSSSSDRQSATENYVLSKRAAKKNFIKGLHLALELESANAILIINGPNSQQKNLFSTNGYRYLHLHAGMINNQDMEEVRAKIGY